MLNSLSSLHSRISLPSSKEGRCPPRSRRDVVAQASMSTGEDTSPWCLRARRGRCPAPRGCYIGHPRVARLARGRRPNYPHTLGARRPGRPRTLGDSRCPAFHDVPHGHRLDHWWSQGAGRGHAPPTSQQKKFR
jgi:hypothetical protein